MINYCPQQYLGPQTTIAAREGLYLFVGDRAGITLGLEWGQYNGPPLSLTSGLAGINSSS